MQVPSSLCMLTLAKLTLAIIQGGEPEKADSTSSCTWTQSAPVDPGGPPFTANPGTD